MSAVFGQFVDMEQLINVEDYPWRMTVGGEIIHFAEIEGIEERFPPGYDQVVYVPHLIRCGDLIIRDIMFVNKPNFLEWINKYSKSHTNTFDVLVELLDQNGEPYYAWRYLNICPKKVILDEPTLKCRIAKVKYISFTNSGHIREK